MVRDGSTLDDAVNMFLFDYRSTEHCTTGRSPAWLMYKRELRTRFDLIRPNVKNDVERKQFDQKTAIDGKRKCNLTLGEKVFVKDNRTDPKYRSEAVIMAKNSPSTYTVKFNDNTVAKKHANQIVKTKWSEKEEKEESVRAKASKTYKVQNKVSPSGVLPRRSARLRNKVKA